MTHDELKHIFRFQTTAEEDYVPPEQVDYLLVDGQTRITQTHDVKKLETIIPLIEGYEFEGYRDRMPVFIKPEV